MAEATDNRINVATVCGTEVRIYGELEDDGMSRRFLQKMNFPTYGAAKLYADEYEDSQRESRASRR